MQSFTNMGSVNPWSSGKKSGIGSDGTAFGNAFQQKHQLASDLTSSRMGLNAANASNPNQANPYNPGMGTQPGISIGANNGLPTGGYDVNNTVHAQQNRHAAGLREAEAKRKSAKATGPNNPAADMAKSATQYTADSPYRMGDQNFMYS